LIDELDRTDEPFEAYLLEVLSDWQITIPEVGTLRAPEPPIVVITSNRTREIHDAVKRRCFYHWVDFPDAPRELEILHRKAPKAREALSKEVVTFVQRLRKSDLFKLPGVAETIDWANCLVALVPYQGLDERQRDAFYDALARQYSPSAEAVSRAAAAYQAEPTPENLLRLQNSVEPARQELFRRLNMAPGGTAALVEMRRRLLTRLETHPHWRAIDLDLMHLLRSWFYSITSCQEGLRGTSFGNLLIKQVAEDLKRELPHLRRFATLSPIPGFRGWLDENRMRVAVGAEGKERLALLSRLEDPAWHLGEVPEALQSLLMRLCAYYLLNAKQGLEPLDAVARFHLGNGAALERLNWMGDSSEQGMSRSAGLMVNFVYWLAELEKNHERYFREHFIADSPVIEQLAREAPVMPAGAKGEAGP